MTTKKATTQDYLVVAVIGLLGFTAFNFIQDYIFLAQQNEINEGFNKMDKKILESVEVQTRINEAQKNLNIIFADALIQIMNVLGFGDEQA